FYHSSGKTGTAQVADKGIKYSDGVYQGSFVGYFPSEKPKYTITVVIRTKPHSSAYYGGTVAAPVFRMIADKIFASGVGSWAGPLDSFSKVSDKLITAKPSAAKNYGNIFNILNLDFQMNTSLRGVAKLEINQSGKVIVGNTALQKNVVPNVTGMGLKDAVYLLEKTGLNVRNVGSGTVINQSIPPGTKANKGQDILLDRKSGA